MTVELQPATDTTTPSAEACVACGHDDAAHDTTGRRYCAATAAGSLSRTCICRGL